MKTITLFFKKTVLTLAIMLMTAAGAWAQALNWTGTQTLTNGQNITQNITLNGDVTVDVSSGTATISGVISGAFRIIKTGVGALVLTGANTYSGATSINSGTLQVGNGISTTATINSTAGVTMGTGTILRFEPASNITFSKVIGGFGDVQLKGNSFTCDMYFTADNTYTGTTTVEAGRFLLGNNSTAGMVSGNIILNANTQLYFNRSNEISYTYVISGAGHVRKYGANKLTLLNTNTYTGTTVVDNGTLQIGNGMYTISSIGSTSDVTVNSGAVLRFEPGANTTFSKVISGAGKVEYAGSNSKKLTLTAANTYTGATTISGGTLQIGNETSKTETINSTSGVELLNSDATLRFEPGGYLPIFSKVISGAGKVESKASNGAYGMYFTANNTYTGTTTVEVGYIFLGNGSTAGMVAGNIILNANNTSLYFNRSNDITYSGVISGAGQVIKDNTNKLTLNNVNTYTGQTTIYNNGTLALGTNGSIANSSSVTFSSSATNAKFDVSVGNITIKALNSTTNNAEVILGTNTLIIGTNGGTDGTGTFAGKITGNGSIIKRGSGKLILTGANTYTGSTIISDGTLQVGDGTSTTATINNTSNVNINYLGAILRFEPGADMTFSKVISGLGKVESKAGASNYGIYFTADNTCTGTTTVEAGGLLLGNGSTAGMVAGNIILNAGTSLYFYRSNETTYSGVISGTGQVRNYGSNKLTLNNTNTYTGNTYLDGTGTLVLGASGSIENSSSVVINVASKFDISAGNKKIKALYGANAGAEVVLGTSTLTIGTSGGADGGSSYAGIISGTGSIVKTGTAKLTLTGANTYSGSTSINSGTLQIGNGTSTTATIGSTSGVSVALGATLRFEPGANMIFSKVISGAGSVQSTGDWGNKALFLTGANTYTGTTTIETGSLAIGNNTTTGAIAGPVSINAGAYLDIRRSNEYTYANVISGAGNVYKYNAGKFILTGANTYTGLTSINGGTLEIGGTAGTIAGNINIESGATLSIARTVDWTYGGVISGAGGVTKTGMGTFIIYAAYTATGVFQHNNGAVSFGNNSKWAGAYNKAAGTTLYVNGNVSIGGALTLAGGDIRMRTSGNPASKLTVGGAVSASGTNTLDIIEMGTANSYDLIVAASGIPNTTPYALTGATGYSLAASGTKLTLMKDAAPTKTVSVGSQSGTMIAGIAGTVTFPVSTANITNGSYTPTVAGLPTGVSVQGQVTINNNNGTLTLSGNTSTVAGATNTLRLTIDGTQSGQFTLTVDKNTGIDEISDPSPKAYPNPFTDALRITDAEGYTLRVMNIAGTTVLTQQIISPDETLGLKYLPSGVYFFRFEKEGNMKTVKVIKN